MSSVPNESRVIVIGLTIRNSTTKQIGNYRSEVQGDLAERIRSRGCEVRIYDEQGVSGADLDKRAVARGMLDDLKKGVIHGIAAYDVKRLTRDEFGIDGATIARRITEAGGRFHTWDREYNLRLDDDLMQFQFQCFIAGIDWRNIRNTLWSGIFKKLEQEPHYMKTPLGYMTVADERGKKHIAKNPAHYSVIAELARLFDACDSLAEIARTLNANGPERPKFRGRGGTSTHWHVHGLRYILNNSIYTGTFKRSARQEHSTVWEKFALDPATGQTKEFVHHRPELTYWDAARVRRWQRKFAEPANARIMRGLRSQHALLGVLECLGCGQRMIAHGSRIYACSAIGSGRGRKGIACTAPQLLAENIVLQLLRHEFPRVMHDAQDLAERYRAQLSKREPSTAAQRLAFLEERVVSVSQQIIEEPALARALGAQLAKTQKEIDALAVQVAEEEDARLEDENLARTCETLMASPLEAFDALPADKQARVFAIVFSGVRIETQGIAAGRRWRLQRYEARIGDEERITADAPWATLPNPMAKATAHLPKDRVIFGPATGQPMCARRISARVYGAYLTSLREMAGVLASSAG